EYFPCTNSGEIIIHSNYSLSYSEKHEQAEWVYYWLTPDRILGNARRVDKFKEDPNVLSGSSKLDDYKGSGFDRGHLCPAADNKNSDITMEESFFMSNMSPQLPAFNRGIWKKLEVQFRDWALALDGLYIVTAGILADSLHTIGMTKVSVPKYFYKIAYSPKKKSMIAFILENKKLDLPLESFIVSVDSVEAITHLDFFPQLDDDLEDWLESKVFIEDWIFYKKED
ncbi:MAG: DNA/RNA non-specific endonuclease, partial [Cyclobacteriaceae bacterium]|nr:DNA/RNA non-specific endonuclease [Cyclobacteriaceae bacterium]